MSSPARPPDDDWVLAAELAFGLLDADARIAAERRVVGEAAFAGAVEWWREQAMVLTGDVHEAPPAALWHAIARGLPANDIVAPDQGATVRRWRAAAVSAAVAAVILGVVAVQPYRAPLPPPPSARAAPRELVAVLTQPDRPGVVTVSFDPGTRRMTTAPAHLDPGARAAELWVIPADGRPRSLGVMSASAPGSPAARPAALAALAAGVTLAVSLEPAGGSVTGAPTGPVILTGKMILV